MGLHELGHDLVLAGELGFELLDLGLLGIFDGLRLATVFKDGMAVLEEFLLPAVEHGGGDAELIANGRDGYGLEQVPLEGSDLLLRGEVTTFSVHLGTSVQVMLTRTE